MTSRQKELKKQGIEARRGAYGRERKKKFQRLKNTGQLDQYLLQKAGVRVEHRTIKSSTSPGVQSIPWWRRIINFIKRLFKRK